MYHIGCTIFGTKRKRKPKNIRKKKSFQAGRIWWFWRISDHYTSRRLCGLNIFSMCIWMFCAVITLWYEELELVCSWFCYHAHWRLHSIFFACKVDDKLVFLIFFLICWFFFRIHIKLGWRRDTGMILWPIQILIWFMVGGRIVWWTRYKLGVQSL